MDNIERLAKWLDPLIAGLSEAQLLRLSRTLGQRLRQNTSRRIAQQRNPDGTPFEARKKPGIKAKASQRRGRVKRAMFNKARTLRFLKLRITSKDIGMGFMGRTARIMRVHQEGLTDKLGPQGPNYDFPARELLGWSKEDEALIKETVINYLKECFK